jgi:hypothetical protein
MTDSELPKRGRQGVQGIQGVEGIEGPAGGKAGPKGEPGKQGTPGKNTRVTWRDFWLLAITGIGLWALLNASGETNARIAAIQAQRRQSVNNTCVAQDQRHDATIKRLNAGLNAAEKTASPAQLAQVRQSRAFTISLINALAPKQNCQAAVKRALAPAHHH